MVLERAPGRCSACGEVTVARERFDASSARNEMLMDVYLR
jgi:hypothetical protein